MNDVAPPGLDSAATPPEPAPVALRFGPALAQARQARGLSLADIAARLRLHPRQIAAIEEERLDSLPAAPFVRGFVRNYAKELQLDPEPLLAALAAKLPFADASAAALTTTGISAVDLRRSGTERYSRIAVIGGTVLLLVVLGLIGWIASQRVAAPQDIAPTPAAVPRGAPQPDSDRSGAPQSSTAAPADATDAAGSAASRAGVLAAAEAPAQTAPPAAAVGGGLRLVVGERPSWVEITQADGRIVLTGLQEAGTERRLGSPQPPLQVVIGNASSVTLEYRGKAIDLGRHVRANDLARLTLE